MKKFIENKFYAYPSSPSRIGSVIEDSLLRINNPSKIIKSWRESDVFGDFIINTVTRQISSSDIFIEDISRLNLNVIYEIVYSPSSNDDDKLSNSIKYVRKMMKGNNSALLCILYFNLSCISVVFLPILLYF